MFENKVLFLFLSGCVFVLVINAVEIVEDQGNNRPRNTADIFEFFSR